jgi:pilus assembly protein CpaB
MNRRSRHLVVLMVAVVTAGIASFAVYRAILHMPARAAEAPHHPVVVAAHSMAIGTELTERDVKVLQWPSGSLVPGAISDVKTVLSRGLMTAVLENEPITANKLASTGAGAGLSPAIPRGMRAMSVKVNDVIGVAGFVVPGTRVDVVVTIRRTSDSMTRTAASNVQVLAAGTRLDQGKSENDSKTPASTVVTLIVSPQDAERIALAQAEGEIMLMLRNQLDTEPTMTTGVKTASLLGQEDAAPAPTVKPAPRRAPAPVAAPAPVEPPPPAPRTVEAIRAAKRTDEVIK